MKIKLILSNIKALYVKHFQNSDLENAWMAINKIRRDSGKKAIPRKKMSDLL